MPYSQPFLSTKTLDLNTIHRVVGGTSQTTCSLNDTDINARSGTVSGTTAKSFRHLQSGGVHSYIITPGGSTSSSYGYNDGEVGSAFGSVFQNLTNITNIYGSWEVIQALWFGGMSPPQFYFRLSKYAIGDTASNSGWEQISLGTTSLFRQDANYSVTNSDMVWIWNNVSSNPFNTSGTTTLFIR